MVSSHPGDDDVVWSAESGTSECANFKRAFAGGEAMIIGGEAAAARFISSLAYDTVHLALGVRHPARSRVAGFLSHTSEAHPLSPKRSVCFDPFLKAAKGP
jgi:hypothetical protein